MSIYTAYVPVWASTPLILLALNPSPYAVTFLVWRVAEPSAMARCVTDEEPTLPSRGE